MYDNFLYGLAKLKFAICSILFACILSFCHDNPEIDIVGTWIHESEIDTKWEFTNNGICKWYDENGTVTETFTYSISYTSPQCGYEVKSNGNQFSYLKLIDTEGDEYCYDIHVDNQTLSINYLGTAGYDLFTKQ